MGYEADPPRPGPVVSPGSIFLIVVTIIVFLLPIFIYFPPTLPSVTEALLQTHSKIGLDEYQRRLPRHSKRDSKASTNGPGKIRSLWIFPVKSCKGIEVLESKVVPAGLEYDRIYTFAQLKSPFPVGLDTPDEGKKEHSWEFISQRQFPRLATIHVDLYVPDICKARSGGHQVLSLDNTNKSSSANAALGDSFIVVRFPWQELGLRGTLAWLGAKLSRGLHAVPEKEIILPVSFPSESEIEARKYKWEPVKIWRDTVTALNMEADLPRELRLYLGVSNRLGLFRVDPARLREVYRNAPKKEEAGYQPVTGWQDAYPVHMLNLSSVQDFDAKIDKDDNLKSLDPLRFRANIIVDGVKAYEEETWKTIRFNPGQSNKRQDKTNFHVSCRTVRCKMPNVDQDTGFRHPSEPDRSLRKYRDVDPGIKGVGCLGMQLTPLFNDPTAEHAGSPNADDIVMDNWVEVGMDVEVLSRGPHRYARMFETDRPDI
ncbi:hypothetical protein SMACR_00875 [Sordaria macrospora]|uniref:WGS project CABT00000000 data, contig 2.2 n=2 Tax=Sordaria macrospora TaxID=5147 RepID=F7VNB9_SORMK|nr:uncharacterized protein SMAC_00875 [Sordaria macrospora k-hell]KAA8636640.1 hypothetical protein SMACR_00875 [Sordaria macrospora]KAH7630771.1 hypothetical protein B0T09DRAFT_124830 [Sordaria sp. MPI-SDFR-AT-0083]WPJ62115.1 hypothetical protein SMAC4_00875 [Sordaria macrospora]CCC06848.1 unnamed protein product [Sordaria macrospora k-hell]